MSCETPNRPFVVARDTVARNAFVFVPDCGLWSCPHCSQERANQWKVQAFYGASKLLENGKYMAFVTITSRGGAGRTREASIEALAQNWPKLRDYARYWQDELEYILIPEQHKSGVVHAHLICTNILSQRWWKDYGHKAGFGYMNTCSPMQSAAYAPAYVAKYLGKDLHKIQWPDGFRRVRTSQGWPRLADFEAPEGWDYEVFRSRGAVAWEIHLLRDGGYKVRLSETTGFNPLWSE